MAYNKDDIDFLKSIEWNMDFHDALLKFYPDGIPQYIKIRIKNGTLEPYDAGMVADDLNAFTECKYSNDIE